MWTAGRLRAFGLALLVVTCEGGLPSSPEDTIISMRTNKDGYWRSLSDPIYVFVTFPDTIVVFYQTCTRNMELQRWDGQAWRDDVHWGYATLQCYPEWRAFSDSDRTLLASGRVWGLEAGSDPLTGDGVYRLLLKLYAGPDSSTLFPLNERTSNAFRIRP